MYVFFFLFFVLCSSGGARAGDGSAGELAQGRAGVIPVNNTRYIYSQTQLIPAARYGQAPSDIAMRASASPRTDEPLTRAVRCRQNRDQRPDFGENRNAGLAMHCGDPRRVRTSRVGRCTGFVQWALFSVLASWPRRFPVYLVPANELLPRFCSRRRREACGGLIFS